MNKIVENDFLLSNEETYELIIEAQKGNKEAMEKIIKYNKRLVWKIANYYKNFGVSLEDLIQEGYLGLVRAIELFDITKGNAFSTFAFYYIRKAMIYSINMQGRNIKITNHIYEKIKKFHESKIVLERKLERAPSLKEIADYMHISTDDAFKLFVYEKDTASLDFEYDYENNHANGKHKLATCIEKDIMNQVEYVILSDLHDKIEIYFKECLLSDREISIIMLRFGFYNNRIYKQEEVAEIFHITRERVRQIEAMALRKMRNKIDKTKEFLIYMQNYNECLHNLDQYNEAYKDEKNKNKAFRRKYTKRKVV